MPRKYDTQRKAEIAKRDEKSKSKDKQKIVITSEIMCASCKKFSGWTNDDLRYVSGDRVIECKNCKEPCIHTLCKRRDINIIPNE